MENEECSYCHLEFLRKKYTFWLNKMIKLLDNLQCIMYWN